MAKITAWTGAASSDITNAANWSNGVPASGDGDTVIFDGRGDSTGALRAPAGGNWGGYGFALVHIKSGFTLGGASSGSPLILNAARIVFEGSAAWHIQCAAANSTTNSQITNLVMAATSSGELNISSGVNSASYRAKWVTIEKQSGILNIADSTVYGTLYDNGGITSIGVDCVEMPRA